MYRARQGSATAATCPTPANPPGGLLDACEKSLADAREGRVESLEAFVDTLRARLERMRAAGRQS